MYVEQCRQLKVAELIIGAGIRFCSVSPYFDYRFLSGCHVVILYLTNAHVVKVSDCLHGRCIIILVLSPTDVLKFQGVSAGVRYTGV